MCISSVVTSVLGTVVLKDCVVSSIIRRHIGVIKTAVQSRSSVFQLPCLTYLLSIRIYADSLTSHVGAGFH